MGSRHLQATDPNSGGLPDVANLGWVRPPLVSSSSLMAGALLTWLWPLPFALPAAVPSGSTMVFASSLLFLFSVRALRAAGTPVRGNQPTTNIVRTLLVPVGLIGFFEGGYNHGVKNVLYFGGLPRATLDQLFPPPRYEMPNDLWFEVTGILQFFLGLCAAYYLWKLWWESCVQKQAATARTPEG